MNIATSIIFAVLQSTIAQVILVLYRFYTTMDLLYSISTSLILLFILCIYDILLGLVLLTAPVPFRVVIIPFLSALLAAATLTLYPSLGFTIDFWTLFGVLFVAGIFSAVLLLSAGASWRDTKE